MDYFIGVDGRMYVSGEMPPGGRMATQQEVSDYLATKTIAAIEAELQRLIDIPFIAHGYDSIQSACAYASKTAYVAAEDATDLQIAVVAFQEKQRIEGNAAKQRISLVWATAYAYLATVEAGTNPMPTVEEAVAMLPEFTWPT